MQLNDILGDVDDIYESQIKAIEVAAVQKNIVEEYVDKSKRLKIVKAEYEKNRFECECLVDFDMVVEETPEGKFVVSVNKAYRLDEPFISRQDAEDAMLRVMDNRNQLENEIRDF